MKEISGPPDTDRTPLSQQLIESLSENPSVVLVGTFKEEYSSEKVFKQIQHNPILTMRKVEIYVAPTVPEYKPEVLQEHLDDLIDFPAQDEKKFEPVTITQYYPSMRLGSLRFVDTIGHATINLLLDPEGHPFSTIPTMDVPIVEETCVRLYPDDRVARAAYMSHTEESDRWLKLRELQTCIPAEALELLQRGIDPYEE